jgi:outer membrane protein assembly factor BamB
MKGILLILLSAGLLLISCNPEKIATKIDTQGVTVQLSPVWRSSIAENEKYIAEDIGVPLVGEKGIIFPKSKPPLAGQPRQHIYMVLKDQQTGDDLWTWDNFKETYQNVYIYQSYQDDLSGIFYWGDGSRGYGINMQTGNSVWEKTYDQAWAGVPRVAGKEFYYNTLNPKEYFNQAISRPNVYIGNLKTGAIEPLVTPIYSGTIGQIGAGYKQFFGSVNGIRLVQLNGQDHLLFDYFDSTHPTANWYTPRISLYNLAQKKFVYEGLAMKEAGYLLAVNGHLQVNNGKVFDAIDRFTVCHDLLTGKQLWERTFGSLCDYQLAYDDKLLTYISNGFLYCLDANTGKTIWQQETVVTSNMANLNGVVYFTARKALWAVEGNTGKLLWKIESPDWRKNDNARFRGFVAVVPGKNGQKGRVYAHTGLNAYCYEAIR